MMTERFYCLRVIPEGCKPGDVLNVFLYLDNEERLIATTSAAVGAGGRVCLFEVAWINEFGAFLNWGLMKDFLYLSVNKKDENAEREKVYNTRTYR